MRMRGQWFASTRGRILSVSGTVLQEHAQEGAKTLGKRACRAYNKLLGSFRKICCI